jgi:molybdopterin synthase catalytic subunit
VSTRVLRAEVADQALNIAEHEALVADAHAGAVVSFAGVVRDHDGGRQVDRLDYECHPDAERILAEVAADVAARHEVVALAVSHRVGELAIGDLALVACVAAAHRAQAFAACADLVDEVKDRIPVWKLQHFGDGTSEWTGCA